MSRDYRIPRNSWRDWYPIVGRDADGRELVDVGDGLKMHADVLDRIDSQFNEKFGVNERPAPAREA